MADNQTLPIITLPQKSLTITGALTARLYQAAVRASRIDLRSLHLPMAPARVRDPSNRALERIAAAISRFESELTLVENDLDAAGNANNQQIDNRQKGVRAGTAQSRPSARTTVVAKPPEKSTSGSASAQGQSQNPTGGKKKKKNRSRNGNDKPAVAPGESAPAALQQQNNAPQQAPKAPKAAAPAAVAPVVDQPVKQPPAQHQEAPAADVPATIQAL